MPAAREWAENLRRVAYATLRSSLGVAIHALNARMYDQPNSSRHDRQEERDADKEQDGIAARAKIAVR
jgi:hypothetical protein